MGSTHISKYGRRLNSDINQDNGGTPTSHTSAHESTAVAAPKKTELILESTLIYMTLSLFLAYWQVIN